MAVFKCKMCGGALEVNGNLTTTTCEYCGSQQTLPRLNDDKLERLYDRANHFRRNNEFDKAMGIYEQILDENNEDAESYWSIVLCRYGIEYVEDPISHKRIPTINRAQFTSIFDDDNYKSALKYADISQKIIYEQEAVTINEIQKGILDISQKEEPFDIFICYKETDTNGQRTHDSVYANELYHELTQEGFKVFFARITLEDKLGVAYEPYIFAALNSAKVMVVIGTKAEYFNAVWVKNEWSRFLSLIKNGEKKVLIPAYRDMDPYDLPKEFSHLQAQDMNKLGFMPDLVRGIKKLVGAQPKSSQSAPSPSQSATVNASDSQFYNVRLLSYGDKKLSCIAVVRETLGLGLKEAKDLVESNNPMLARNVSIYEAENIKNAFLRNGFQVSIEGTGRISPLKANSISNSSDTETLLKRVTLFLEGGDWGNADIYCEKVLDIDPENTKAYIYKLLAQSHATKEEDLAFSNTPLEGMLPYKNALRFADEDTAKRLIGYNQTIKERLRKTVEERKEKERLEMERLLREKEEAAKQAERNKQIRALQDAQANAQNLITSQLNKANDIKRQISEVEYENQAFVRNSKKTKKFCIATIIIDILLVIFFIVSLISTISSESITGIPVFAGCMFLFIIFNIISTAIISKYVGKSIIMGCLSYITIGFFGFIYAIVILKTIDKKNLCPAATSKLNAQYAKIQQDIEQTRKSLFEINNKINTLKKE